MKLKGFRLGVSQSSLCKCIIIPDLIWFSVGRIVDNIDNHMAFRLYVFANVALNVTVGGTVYRTLDTDMVAIQCECSRAAVALSFV